MRSLGLDPSLRSYGWCVRDDDAAHAPERLVASGHEGTLNTQVPAARFAHFRALVDDLLSRFRVDVVGLESPAYDGGPYSETHFGLMMFSMEAVFEARRDMVLFDPTTLKLAASGDSNAAKTDMQRMVQLDRMSTEIVQADEADAYLVAREAVRLVKLRRGLLDPEDLTETERRVFLTRSKKLKGRTAADGSPLVRRSAHVFRENSRFYEFSRIPEGSVSLPDKSKIRPELLRWLEASGV